MEEKRTLREFQAELSARLEQAGQQQTEPKKLAFQAGGQGWLVDLDQISEVLSVPRLTRAPWAQPWFLGVANVRGTLYGCSDLAAFADHGGVLDNGEIRLLLSHPRFGVNAALRIDRALGLRRLAELQPMPAPPAAPSWCQSAWRDAAGQDWQELNLAALLAEPAFLQAGLD